MIVRNWNTDDKVSEIERWDEIVKGGLNAIVWIIVYWHMDSWCKGITRTWLITWDLVIKDHRVLVCMSVNPLVEHQGFIDGEVKRDQRRKCNVIESPNDQGNESIGKKWLGRNGCRIQ